MRPVLPSLIVVVVGVAALTGGTLLYRAKRQPALTLTAAQTARARENAAGPHVRGEASAPVTLEEFADLQCPPCGMLSGPINDLEKTFRGRLRIVYRHFPLANHAHAREAALAAEAAGMQGRFWEMHDLLYREQPAWEQAADAPALFESYAGTLGLDLTRFRRDRDGEAARARIAADQQRGAELGVRTTPTLFVNAVPVAPEAMRPDRLRGIIAAAINPPPLSNPADPCPRKAVPSPPPSRPPAPTTPPPLFMAWPRSSPSGVWRTPSTSWCRR